MAENFQASLKGLVNQARSAASSVLTSSMVMVMGPTPPGTGVM
jgi:hypothetical protein